MSCFLNIEGTRLEHEWHGPPAAKALTLVLLHEGLGCVELWKNFPESLAEHTGCGVLTYSRAGYGRSDPVPLPRPSRYMHNEALRVLSQVLDAAGVRNAVLVGHSDGGSIALIHAGGVRDRRVKGVVSLAAHVFNEKLCIESIRLARSLYESGDLRAGLARYHDANVDCAFWGWNDAWLSPAFESWNIEEYLPRIRVPVLAIQGANDEYGTASQLDAIRDRVGGAVESILFDDCGHFIHRDQASATVFAIDRFVTGIS